MMGEFKIWFEILVIYIIGAALLVILHIQKTQKWAAQYNAPLHSGELTMIGGIINCRNIYTPSVASGHIPTPGI